MFCTDDCSPTGPIYVWLYCVFNIAYNIFIILVLKYGGATLYAVSSVLLVPVLNLCFALSFLPESVQTTLNWQNAVALVIIVFGLVVYKLYPHAETAVRACTSTEEERQKLAAASAASS